MTGITPPEGSVEAVLLVQAAKREQAMLAETARLSAALDAMTERVEKAERERDKANIAFDGALAELSEALGMKHFTMVSAIAYVRGAVRERDEACARLSSMTERAEYAESEAAAHDAAATVYEHDIRELTARAEKAERERDEARAESYKTMALSIARRVRDIHTIVCGEDDSLNPKEQHEAIVDVLRGHHALGPWTASEADLAHRIASDPCVVCKRWPGGSVEYARVVGEEAERAERSHRTLCGDSAQFLLRKAIPWIAAMTERAEKAERERDAASAQGIDHATEAVRLAAEVEALRSRVAELEAAMPTDDERYALGMALDSKRPGFLVVFPWLARLDAAKGVGE